MYMYMCIHYWISDHYRYTFYDGPPFATGLPHYGHILAGTIKDVVTRWAHQTGYHVERRFGWDCHGLPVVRRDSFHFHSLTGFTNLRSDDTFLNFL